MKHEHSFIHEVFAEIYKPRDLERIGDWAKRCIKLPTIEGEYAGLPYDVGRTPIIQHFFQWWQSEDSTYKHYVTMKGSQDGRTAAAIVATAYDFAHEPCSTMYLSNTDDMAAAVGRFRFVPILRQAAPEINDAIDDSGEGAVFKVIKGALFLCSGGTVPTRLASWSLKKVHIDEAALHRSTEVGTTIDLSDKRTSRQTGSKLNVFSKPEQWPKYRADPRNGSLTRISTDKSIFTEKWMSGTQHVPMVPCPHCNGFQELHDGQLKALPELLPSRDLSDYELDLKAIERATWYECWHCKEPIYDHQKAEMVRKFEMRPAPIDAKLAKAEGFARARMIALDPRHPEITRYRNPDPEVFSCHVSDIYNIFSAECAFGKIHRKFLAAKNDPEKFAIYCKDIRGEPPPETPATAAVTAKLLERLKGTHLRLNCIDPITRQLQTPQYPLPIDPMELSLTVDYQAGQITQAAFFPFVITAFDEDWKAYLVDYGIANSLDDLFDLLQIEFTSKSGIKGRITSGLMDAQFDPATVIGFCLRDGIYPRIFPARGVSKLHAIDRVDMSAKAGGIPFYAVNFKSTYFEEHLYRWQFGKWAEILDPSRSGALNAVATVRHAAICPRMFLPADVCSDYLEQASNMAEGWVNEDDPSKGTIWRKIFTSKPNDFGDCTKLAIINRRLRKGIVAGEYIRTAAAVEDGDAA